MDYASVLPFESKVSIGTSYSLKKMSHGRRVALNIKAAAIFAKVSEAQRNLETVLDEIKEAEKIAKTQPCTCDHPSFDQPLEGAVDGTHHPETLRCLYYPCPCREAHPDPEIGDYNKRDELNSKVWEIITNELYPEYILWGVKEINGLTIDGKPATAETLVSDGPEVLTAELGAEIYRIIGLTNEEVLGFKLPTISGAPMDGQTPSTTASPASATA